MRAVATAFVSVGVLTLLAMTGFGLHPQRTSDLLPRAAYGLAGGLMVLGLILHLVALVFVDARRTEAAGIDPAAAPVREFGYRRQRFQAGIVFALAGLLAAPLVAVVPVLALLGVAAAGHPAVVGLSAFVFLFAVVLFVVGRRGWYARVTVYADRLAVRGIYSNGSLRWDEATAFTHEQVFATEWDTMWVYVLSGGGRRVRVEYTVESPDEFVRQVEARTGLTLAKRPQP